MEIEKIRRTTKNVVYGNDVYCAKCGERIKYNEGFSVKKDRFYHLECLKRR